MNKIPLDELEKTSLSASISLPTIENTAIQVVSKDEIFESTKSLSAACSAYFLHCNSHHIHPTTNGLALALGLTRKDLLTFPEDSIHFPIITAAKQKIAAMVEASLLTSPHPTGAFAWLKNNDDWADKSEVKNIKQVTAAEVIKRMSLNQSLIEGEITEN